MYAYVQYSMYIHLSCLALPYGRSDLPYRWFRWLLLYQGGAVSQGDALSRSLKEGHLPHSKEGRKKKIGEQKLSWVPFDSLRSFKILRT
jgi:hypothetical protein